MAMIARNKERLESLSDKLPNAESFPCDLTDRVVVSWRAGEFHLVGRQFSACHTTRGVVCWLYDQIVEKPTFSTLL